MKKERLLAASVAGLFLMTGVAMAAQPEATKPGATETKKPVATAQKEKNSCKGKNGCKGKEACKGKEGCKGKHSCKGKDAAKAKDAKAKDAKDAKETKGKEKAAH